MYRSVVTLEMLSIWLCLWRGKRGTAAGGTRLAAGKSWTGLVERLVRVGFSAWRGGVGLCQAPAIRCGDTRAAKNA